MATPASKQRVTLLKTGQYPTMVSSRPAQSLAPNQFPLLQNVRTRFGVLEAKKSETAWTFTGLPSTPTIYGAWAGSISNVEYAILAVKNGSSVDIYDSTDGLAWTVRGQASPSSGIYTSSDLSDSFCIKNGVTFQPVNDPWVGEGVLISDGAKILMYCPNTSTLRVRQVTQFSPLAGYAKDCSITGNFGRNLYDASYAASLTGSTTGGTFTFVAPTSSAAAQVNIAVAQATSHTLTLNFTSAINSTNGRQFAMLLSTTDADCDIFRNCMVQLYVGATPYVIHDPAGTDYNECSLENFTDPNVTYTTTPNSVTQKTLQLYVWNIQNDTFTGDVTKVVFTYKGATNRYKAIPLEILSAGISGTSVSGIPNYAVSYVDTGTGAESGSVVLNSERASGALVTYLTATGSKYFPFPLSYSLRMNWSIKVSPTVPPSSYNALFLYRKDPGSSGYFYVSGSAVSTAAWTGSVGLPTPNIWVSLAPYSLTDTRDETGLDPERPAPTAYNTVPSISGSAIGFTCAAFANNRLFVGSTGQYQFSEYRFPLRFSLGVRLDDSPLTAGGFKFANENPQAFAPLLGDINLDRIALFTDKGAYALAGFDAYSLMRPARLSQFGTLSPKSVVTRRDTIFMLDDARHLRSIAEESGLETRSHDVKDVLDGIPAPVLPASYGITKAWGAIYDDRYHLFYCKNGDTANKYSFVVDLLSGTLVQDSYTTGIVCTFQIGGKLIGVKADGTGTQLESGTSDVTVNVLSREIVTDGDSWLMERQRIYADSNTGKSLTMSWTGFPIGAAPITSSIPLDPVAGSVRIDVSTVLGKGISGRSIQAGFTGAIPGGKKIYEWEFETESRVSRGTV